MSSQQTDPTTAAPNDAVSDVITHVINDAVHHVVAGRTRWATVDGASRAALLDACREAYFAAAPAMVAVALAQKGLKDDAPEAGEEWAFVTGTLKLFRVYADMLRQNLSQGRPRVTGPWTTRADGQVVVQVAPADLTERLSMAGGTGCVWLEPGVTMGETRAAQGASWKTPATTTPAPVVALLGAGNVAMLVPGDVLHAIFLAGQVVVLKLNPVNAALLPMWQQTFAPLVNTGCLAIITGDASAGARLCTHPDVDAVHMTGSHHTHDAVVFGPGPAGATARAAGRVVNPRPITAELGNITPVIVVPGPWTARELRYHAIQLGSQHGLNAAFNCLTPRLIVQSAQWPQRQAFLDELRHFFAALPPRRAYYPGAAARHARFVAAHPNAERFGTPAPDALPWTLITGLDANNDDQPELCFTEESFCAVLAEATIDAVEVTDFLRRAVHFVNTRVWGNLTVTLLVHPTTMADAVAARAVDTAIAELRYGNVCVNTWGSFAYVVPSLPWGAFPGNAAFDIQSGTGFVHNVLDLPRPQKSVLRAPFTVGPTPPLNLLWPKTARLLREVASLEHRASVGGVARVVGALLGR